jgi:TolB-like protein/Flp pilus assembly protein TadD
LPNSLETLRVALAGRYEIQRELGRGGMATVYLAHDVNHDRPVALKVVLPELAASIGNDRFQQEIKLAARLQHPHILSVYDSGEASGQLWFTMPFVEGESLRDRLVRETQLPVEEAVRIVREAALALDYAHRHGVVHRDIKPENILLSDGQALVADFGIARAVGAEGTLTKTGMTVGTPAYMSPEQASGERPLDGRSDIYSLGAVLYELLAGEPPFTGPTAQAIISRALTETPRPLSGVRSAVSPALQSTVSKALARTPADRFSTAAEFAKALGSTSGEVAVTGAVTSATPAAAPSRRWTRIVIPAAIAAFAAAFAGGYFLRHSGGGGAKRIAVLPFENQGAAEDDYFADGVTDEVRSKLAGIPGLQVTARGSTSQYKKSAKTPKEIGRELEVDYLLTGTVRWSKGGGSTSRVRVNPELIQVSNASEKWAAPFEAELSDVFQVQSDIAGKVASALDLALGAGDQERLAARPTRNIEAYDAFLKGEQATQGLAVTDAPHLREGLAWYQKAAELDTTFVDARAHVARTLSSLYTNGPTVEGVEAARVAAEGVYKLAPDEPAARQAMGTYLLNQKKDYTGALEQFTMALKAEPNNADLLTSTAQVERTLGRWEESRRHAEQAAKLDPRAVRTARTVARTLHDMRRYPEALVAFDRALALAPNNLAIIQGKTGSWLSLGRLDSARAVIREALKHVDTMALAAHFSLYQEQMWVLPDEIKPLVTKLTPKDFDGDRGHYGLKVGGTWKLLGDMAKAHAFADTERMAFEAELKQFPEEAQLHELHGRALALGGWKKEAIEEAELSLRLRETALNAGTGPYVKFQVARILIQSGELDRALDLIEPLLTVNGSDLTPAYMRIDPSFAPLKGNPRFEKLIAGK